MARVNSKNIAFTVPPVMADEFERLAQEEQSTKSELFRRIFRFYQASRKTAKKADSLFETDFDAWVEKTIFEAIEEKENNPISKDELLKIDEKLLRYGAERAQAFGVTSEAQIDAIVYEERQKRRR